MDGDAEDRIIGDKIGNGESDRAVSENPCSYPESGALPEVEMRQIHDIIYHSAESLRISTFPPGCKKLSVQYDPNTFPLETSSLHT
jgi:hypothetical protein